MHAQLMAEVSGWLSITSDVFARGGVSADTSNAMRYWAASKCRFQRWQSALKVFEDDLNNPCEMHDPWHAIEVVAQEILVSEMLTRVWTVVLINHDTVHQDAEMQCIGHSVFIGHLEARNRVLRLLLHNRATNQKVYDRLDDLRRRMERWTDLLLSRVSNIELAEQFGFDEKRVQDFAADRHLENHDRRKQMERLLLASLASSLRRNLSNYSANPDLNREIVSGILACIPSDRFDSNGLPKSLMLMQMEQVQSDTQGMVESLLEDEDSNTL